MNARLLQPDVDDALEDDDDDMPAVSPELLQEWERRAAEARNGRTRGLSYDEVKAMVAAKLDEIQARRR
ncbi:MAG: hypothetical protein JNL82_15215 [Myxococcales bacterium]|nr:hypothetical protein [Myxococcales bacterium]